jgi:multidrug resistance efflux pump
MCDIGRQLSISKLEHVKCKLKGVFGMAPEQNSTRSWTKVSQTPKLWS